MMLHPECLGPLPTLLLRAGSKGKKFEPGKGSEPAWRSPQEPSWSPSASLDTPRINKKQFRLAAKTHLRFKCRVCCSGGAGKLSAAQTPSLKSKPGIIQLESARAAAQVEGISPPS